MLKKMSLMDFMRDNSAKQVRDNGKHYDTVISKLYEQQRHSLSNEVVRKLIYNIPLNESQLVYFSKNIYRINKSLFS
jgi:hypothetical protein